MIALSFFLKHDNEGMLRQAPTSTLSKHHLTSIANKPIWCTLCKHLTSFLSWRRLDDDMNNERCRNLEDRNMRLLSFADVRSARWARIVQTRGAERGYIEISLYIRAPNGENHIHIWCRLQYIRRDDMWRKALPQGSFTDRFNSCRHSRHITHWNGKAKDASLFSYKKIYIFNFRLPGRSFNRL